MEYVEYAEYTEYFNICDDSNIALSIGLTFASLLDMYVSPKYLYSI
jgi:hypothetical protein